MSRAPGSWLQRCPCSRAALPVALPGDGGVAAAGLADLAGREHEVDAGEHVVDALGVVLDAARVQQHRARRLRPERGRLDGCAAPGCPTCALDGVGRVVGDGRRHVVEAVGVRGDEVVVDAAEPDHLVQDGVQQRHVAARASPAGRGRRCARSA